MLLLGKVFVEKRFQFLAGIDYPGLDRRDDFVFHDSIISQVNMKCQALNLENYLPL